MASSKSALNIFLWISQGILAALFTMAGIMKSTQPVAELAATLPWVNDFSAAGVRFVGITELLGGIGVLLPSLLRIKPVLAPLAALGLAVIMVLAFIYHVVNGEYDALAMNIVLGALALFVAWGRYGKAAIAPKG